MTMGRVKGAKNKPRNTSKISSEDKLRMIANIIIDRILEERETGRLIQIIKLPK